MSDEKLSNKVLASVAIKVDDSKMAKEKIVSSAGEDYELPKDHEDSNLQPTTGKDVLACSAPLKELN